MGNSQVRVAPNQPFSIDVSWLVLQSADLACNMHAFRHGHRNIRFTAPSIHRLS